MADIKKITSEEEFQEFVNTPNLLNITKISASWCGPCRVLADTIKSLNPEEVEGVMLGEVDVDEDWFEDVATELKIRGVPVLIAFRDGDEVERVVGNQTKDNLLAFFNRNK